jgi:glycosyltransferase involved in cell wall biosynthesis
MLNIAVLEPYCGGSHAAFVDAFTAATRHNVTLATLPARKWKWRMRGAAIWFAAADKGWQTRPIDLILCSDMLSVTDLRALLPADLARLPIVCYFHENQLTYPLPEHDSRDYQYGMTNITSCLAADAVWFNSRFHLEDFLAAADALLAKMPDFVPPGLPERIRRKASVQPPPVRVPQPASPADKGRHPVRIVWCHRWEFDKNPEPLFEALVRLAEDGLAYELVLVGEQFRTAPEAFARIRRHLGSRIVHAGYLAERSDYLNTLAGCDVVVSSAIQENFGIAAVEAILSGCQPVLPRRLAYPEVIPEEFHDSCLYAADGDLYEHLRCVIEGPGRISTERLADLQGVLRSKYDAKTRVAEMDAAFESVVGATPA